MTPSKTYLKFQETRSKEDLDTLNGYLLRLQQISVILNGDTELSNEEENKLSTFSNHSSNENQTNNINNHCHGSSSHGIPYQ